MAGRLLPFRRQRADADDAYTSDDSFATSDLLGSRSMGWTGSSVSTSEVGDADYQILGGVRPDSADNFLAWDPAYAFNGAGDDGVYFFSARDPATNTVACNVSGCSRRIVIGPGQARSAVQRVLYAHWSARHSPAARMKDAARKAVEAKLKGVAKIDDVEEWVKEIAVRPRCKEPGYKPEEEAAGSEADPDKARCIDSDVYFFSAADEEGRSRCLHEGCPAVIAWRHAGVRGQPLQPLRRHWERFHSATTTKSCAREAKARHEAAAFAAAATLEDVTDWYPRRAVAPKDWAPTPAAPVGYYFAAPDAEGYLRCLHPGCGVRLSGADKSNLKKHWVRRHSPAAMPKRTKRVRAGTGLTPAQKKHEIATSASAADFTEWHPSRAYRPDPAAPGAYFFGPPQRDGTVECAVPGCTSKLVLGHLGNLEKHWIRMHLLRPAASETTSPAAAPTFTPLPGVTVTPPPGATQTAAPHHPALQHRLSPLPVKAARVCTDTLARREGGPASREGSGRHCIGSPTASFPSPRPRSSPRPLKAFPPLP
eukprot:TRINITY_DN3331_c0_g2_i2.p1 TRINITY_DN3331_c0_g2~~TRINITY_DN3331_c0_g2_i2.p1  ORF type:complete len:537 (+),score=96.25 TRINITY_DN3331_c0_g2_i2:102-1712(+)